jgi:hypothetical protein
MLNPGTVVFTSVPPGSDLADLAPIATMREAEGVSLILAEDLARAAALPIHFRAAWITLTVSSALEAVGLTPAVAGALAAAGISCNVVAGTFHDHLFVPVESAREAIEVLEQLSKDACRKHGQ